MASFKFCVRKVRKDGFMPVYLRLIHNRQTAYIKTSWIVDAKGVKRDGSIKDSFVMLKCMNMISGFIERLNSVDSSHWNVKRVKDYLCSGGVKSSFSEYATRYIGKMEMSGSHNNAHLYTAALRSLERYMGTENIAFEDLTRGMIEHWILSLKNTKRARTLYPVCLRMVFNDAVITSQEPSSGLAMVIKYNPWNHVTIPSSEVPRKRAIGAKCCYDFFSFVVDDEKHGSFRAQLGKDVAMLSFCLAGINTVDLFKLRKTDLRGDVIRYRRSKTSSRRSDGAYFEMKINKYAAELIEKYKASDESPLLLWFGERYCDAKTFNVTVNNGIRQVCELMGMEKDDFYSVYSFRHTWATIARNDCGASLSEVGFAMNHLQSDGVTRGYIKIDYSPAWELNAQVLDFVFSSSHEGSSVRKRAQKVKPQFELTERNMVYARAYFRGEILAEVSDIGFDTVDEVIDRLTPRLPDTIPEGCAVQFRIKNLDTDREAVYERTKGKGF